MQQTASRTKELGWAPRGQAQSRIGPLQAAPAVLEQHGIDPNEFFAQVADIAMFHTSRGLMNLPDYLNAADGTLYYVTRQLGSLQEQLLGEGRGVPVIEAVWFSVTPFLQKYAASRRRISKYFPPWESAPSSSESRRQRNAPWCKEDSLFRPARMVVRTPGSNSIPAWQQAQDRRRSPQRVVRYFAR